MRLVWPDLLAGRVRAEPGQEVELSGWILPTEPSAPLTCFLLVPELPCCTGCVPSDSCAAVEVFALSPVQPGPGPIRLRGRWSEGEDPLGWRFQVHAALRVDLAITRRGLIAAGPLMCLVACTPEEESAQAVDRLATARSVIAGTMTADAHSHAGAIIGVHRVESNAPFRDVAGPMRAGGLAIVCLAMVADSSTHRVMADHRIHPFRDPAPGELYAWSALAFERVHRLVAEQRLGVVTDLASLARAGAGVPHAIIAAEGADFTEGRPERVDEAYERWQLRHLQLTHYRPNELGDIQTEPPLHGGLTDAGAEIIRRCNRRGLVVDVAHGTYALVKRAASVTTKPLVLSHTSLAANPKPRSRLISPGHARIVAETGGVIGIWPPASIFPDLRAMSVGMARMADIVGTDHVALGTDMMGLVGPSTFGDYALLPDLAAAMLEVGFSQQDVGKILGGNYLRVLRTSLVG